MRKNGIILHEKRTVIATVGTGLKVRFFMCLQAIKRRRGQGNSYEKNRIRLKKIYGTAIAEDSRTHKRVRGQALSRIRRQAVRRFPDRKSVV